MIKNIKWILIASLGVVSCAQDDVDTSGIEPEVTVSAGNADFSKYVALGNSITAGFSDNALFKAGQMNAYPKLMADQFALVGVSDSANLVAFYENDKWSVRGAYNWRGEFLASNGDGSGANPMYTEAYGQLDVNVGYKWNKNLSLQAEVINLNDGIQRLHGRSSTQVDFVTQTGPRYMFGARYKF